MRRIDTLIIAIMLSAGLYIAPRAVQAQARPGRRAIENPAPVYPELAKRAHIKGVVRMELAVRANGSVRSVRVLGGNAALLESATEAVHRWKFEPAAQETTEVVQITFQPQ
jgi:TonB family protein